MKKMKTGFMVLWIVSLMLFTLTVTNLSAQVNRGAGVPAEDLPESFKDLDIKDYFISASQKKVGVIHDLAGHVVVTHRATKEAFFGRPGDTIYENDAINTLADSRCRLRFFDEDVVTMAAETDFAVESFVDKRKEGKKSSLFSMVKGKAMFYAMRLFRYKETRFRLKTPTAIVGVRGTKFGTHVYWVDGSAKHNTGIKVADKGSDMGLYLAQAGPGGGGRSFTDAFSVDGVLDVVVEGISNIVLPGNMFQGMVGKIIPTPLRS